jgi:hypothetical protein
MGQSCLTFSILIIIGLRISAGPANRLIVLRSQAHRTTEKIENPIIGTEFAGGDWGFFAGKFSLTEVNEI